MAYSEFTQAFEAWCGQGCQASLECWVDDAQFQISLLGGGLRCSLEICQGWDPARIGALLGEAGAGLACGCQGALAFDPQAHALMLVECLPAPAEASQILTCLENLANQRAAMLSLASAHPFDSTPSNLKGIEAR
ncbi:hypothetical protein SAMN05216588_105302 [Pseudomonas flavescens]|uniref:Tir chaperone protein (CesT) family protein n=1 Tax=Phytopseudomonas flavescens TaxID=29435 RepID=A0A1G8DL90_9GAMM|nr:hypothetical protein [Pseudomonas flavescens]SDH58422.1 hypothetical protein SAMN05216588_105302 [Pseudomonas flavescens]